MNPIVEKVYQIGIIPVIAFNSVDEALPLCKALAEGGLPAAEVTFRTACAEECIRKIHEEMPEMLLGAGTVLTTEQADRAMAAGASFIVAPGFDPEVCKHVIDKGGIMMPGTASAGEMQQAMNMGCEALKFFPAEANGGVGMLKNIGAALKGARWMCTGGVNAKNVNDYLGYDQIFAVGGTWMCKSDVIKAGDWAKITAAEGELQAVGLNETLVVEGLQTNHQLAKGNDFHSVSPFMFVYHPAAAGIDGMERQLCLNQMECKAGDLALHVAGDGLAVLDILAVEIELHAALRQVVDRTIHVVAADGDVAVGAAARLLHDLEFLVADENAGVAGSDLHIQHCTDEVGDLHGLLLVAGVDADMVQVQTQHGVNGFLALSGDLCPVASLDDVALAHPSAADSKDLVIAQIIVDVLGVDAAGAHPAGTLQGSADVLQHTNTAVCLSREELQSLAAHVHGLLHLTGGSGAGHHDAALVDDVLADFGVEAGSNDEGSTGCHCAVSLLGGQDSASAQ